MKEKKTGGEVKNLVFFCWYENRKSGSAGCIFQVKKVYL